MGGAGTEPAGPTTQEGPSAARSSNNGICDPGSWPWHTDARAYAPTPDRNGRSVRGPAFDLPGSGDWKSYLDTVGPLVAWLEVYADLFGYSTGVYQPPSSWSAPVAAMVAGLAPGSARWLLVLARPVAPDPPTAVHELEVEVSG